MANNMHMDKDDLEKHYSKRDERGRGGFGKVHIYGIKDEQQNSGFRKRVAVKTISEEKAKSADREIEIMTKLTNQVYIVQILGSSKSPYQIYMECYNTDLSKYAKAREFGLSQSDVFKIKKDILKGLQTLIKFGIIHLDIKPANLLIDYNGSDGSRVKDVTIKLGDFGLSRDFSKQRMESGGLGKLMKIGTDGFMAPEIALENQGSYTAQVDTWGCAASVLYLICKGNKPLNQDFLNRVQNISSSNQDRDKEIAKKILELAPTSYSDVTRILLELLKWSPQERKPPDATLATIEPMEENDVPPIETVSANTTTTYVTAITDQNGDEVSKSVIENDSPENQSNADKKNILKVTAGILLFLLLISIGIMAGVSSYNPKSIFEEIADDRNGTSGSVYFIAGGIGAKRNIELYHSTIENLMCTITPPGLPSRWSWHQSFYHNKTIHLCGGRYTASTCISYNSQMTEWKRHDLNPPRKWYHSVIILQNTLYIIGGFDSRNNLLIPMSTPLPLTERPDMTSVPNLKYKGQRQCTTKLDEDTLVIIGGSDRSGKIYFSAVTQYNTLTKEEKQLPSLLQPRRSHGCVMVEKNNRKWLIVSGGWNGGTLQYTEVLELGGTSWSFLGNLNEAKTYHSSAVTARGVLVMGGKTDDRDSDSWTTTVELLEWPATDEWKVMDPSLKKARYQFGGAVEIPPSMFNCTEKIIRDKEN